MIANLHDVSRTFANLPDFDFFQCREMFFFFHSLAITYTPVSLIKVRHRVV